MSKETSKKTESTSEVIRSFIYAVILAMIFRSFCFEPFHIPSGSMKSTLLVGDYVFVSKYSYGYSRYSLPFGLPIIKGRIFDEKPKRGDVIVFKLPSNPSINYIKRLIGMPGDAIQVINGTVYINNQEVKKERIANFIDIDESGNRKEIPQFIETLPNGVSYRVLDETKRGKLDNTPVYIVPEGHYFMLGDNRDNSIDSRVLEQVGYVPEINLLGPAKIIFFSTTASLFKFWQWLGGFREDRFFLSIIYNKE